MLIRLSLFIPEHFTFLRRQLVCVLVAAAFPGFVSGRAAETTTPISPYTDGELIAINSTIATDYQRILGSDGKPLVETYAFGEGGLINRVLSDKSVDGLTFATLINQLAPVLAQQGYVSGSPPAETKLMIMVYWGMTGISPMVDSFKSQSAGNTSNEVLAMMNRLRDIDNRENARLIGYRDAIANSGDRPDFQHTQRDLLGEIEDARYFMVLIAYDFQKLLKEEKTEVRWVTRFSLRAYHRLFDKSLPEMLAQAAPFFGRDSGGLQRNIKTEVKMGEVQILGDKKGEPEAEGRDK